ncbi:MAG: tautomerase family protein [Dermatophilaceae bacterium]|nr:tautomerase family protein [Dermatophilaceae bacterium]
MPIVEITLVSGRSAQELRAMISAVTSAVSETVAAPVSAIRVIIREVPSTHFAAGDVTIAERKHSVPVT